MTRDEHQRAADLFDQIRDLPPGQRTQAINAACQGDPELRELVLCLIAADEQEDGTFLGRAAIEDAARLISTKASLPDPGTVLGNYCLGRRIGSGGMGVVFEAEDLRLERQVALKILTRSASAEDHERIKRFQREALATSQLSHPHIASIFDTGVEQGFHYIAMEFIEGRTMRSLINSESGGIEGRTVLDLLGQIASAISAAHERGIIHRDLKPENIMIRPDGLVKVLDFGLAAVKDVTENKTPDLLTRPGRLAGTLEYLSPEQVMGKPAGAGSDLFSLGVVAYELATGVRPFSAPADGAVLDAIVHRNPPPPSSIRPALGAELDGLILRLLEKDPDLRFQTASDLRSSCRRITRDSSDTAIRLRGTPSTAKWRRFVWLAAAAALFTLILFWLSRPAPALHVQGIQQITHDGLPKEFFVNDGNRIYYSAESGETGSTMFEISTIGGDPLPMPGFKNMIPLDISADGSELLLAQQQKEISDGPPVFVASALGGPPRRLSDIRTTYARWSPKGDEILYALGQELRIARADGSASRLVVKVNGGITSAAWSPDGRFLRFTVDLANAFTLWQVLANGTQLRQLFPEAGRRDGVWSADGHYFLFSAAREIWAQAAHFLPFRHPAFERLTNGPLLADRPQPQRGVTNRIFFRGRLDRAQLVRYDAASDQWNPYLNGLPATQLDYSRDGKWIAYVSYRDGNVWRCAADGSNRMQLTTGPVFAANPRWSPDGTQILFFGAPTGQPARLYLVPFQGGAIRQLTHGEAGPNGDEEGNWSPDGHSIIFSAPGGASSLPVKLLDLNSGEIKALPNSEGLWSVRWSPDGRFIAGLGQPQSFIWLYDAATHEKHQLTTITAGWPSWSRDSQWVIFQNNLLCYRVRISDGKVERTGTRTHLKSADWTLGWTGITPQGDLLSTKDAGSTEIYSLDWENGR